jgi:beta-phosphoglucomutase family hydrolase
MKAFLFDVNGTMIDDMQYHVIAWHKAATALGANISMEQMKIECYGKNRELLERIFPGRFNDEEKDALSLEKEKGYQEVFLPNLKLIDGLDSYLEKAQQHQIPMAIGSAAILLNIYFVLYGLNLRHYFKAIVSAEDVVESKPHPETYLQCAAKLNVDPKDCIVFEDSPKGVESALNAGMKAVAITSFHDAEDFAYLPNVLFIIKDFNDERLLELL